LDLEAINDRGKPMQTIRIRIPIPAFVQLNSDFGVFEKGKTNRFMTIQTKMPYRIPVTTLALRIVGKAMLRMKKNKVNPKAIR